MKRTIRVKVKELIDGTVKDVEAYVCKEEAPDFFLIFIPTPRMWVNRWRQAIEPTDFDKFVKEDFKKFKTDI